MSAITSAFSVQRRALALKCTSSGLCRRPISSPISPFPSPSSSRLVHSTSVNKASASSLDFVEEITLQPIFDIFDAPTRLVESSAFVRTRYLSGESTETPRQSGTTSGAYSPTLPTPLPAPIVFDGPARPQHGALALSKLHGRTGRSHSAKSTVSGAVLRVPGTRTFSSSEPLVQVFEGPAKITRYHHQPSGSEGRQNSTSKVVLALGFASVFGAATTKLSQNDIAHWQ